MATPESLLREILGSGGPGTLGLLVVHATWVMTNRRILIIDDEARIREVVQVCLETIAGWDTLESASAQEGLEQAIETTPDAILLDVSMPDMDGVALFRKLQEHPIARSIPVILLTAKVQPNDQVQFAQLGLAGVIAKPFDPLTLAQQITDILGWPSPG